MYTTNAVQSIDSSFRKVTKKGAFPNESVLLKLFYHKRRIPFIGNSLFSTTRRSRGFCYTKKLTPLEMRSQFIG